MESVYAAFGEVHLCAHVLSPVVARSRILLSEGGDGLVDAWTGRLAFVNPPFSKPLRWLRRAHAKWVAAHVATVVCLVPVRTDLAWFHDELSAVADIFLLRGRIRFLDSFGNAQPTPFSLMMVTPGATDDQKTRFASLVVDFWLARGSPDLQTPQPVTT